MHLKIGTRKSKLALWQANHVSSLLKSHGHTVEMIHIVSEGDMVLDTPLPLIGGKGVFTKALDDALVNRQIDIAVHSFKDVPTQLENNITIAAILERENPTDALVCNKNIDFLKNKNATIATSSNRRKAQWLKKYPNHRIVDIRGNVPTRIEKLKNSNWDATILATAGLKRLNLDSYISFELDWMISAPAQGAVAIASLSDNKLVLEACSELNHEETSICTKIERDFLHRLNGGCSAPVGAKTSIVDGTIFFESIVLKANGSKNITIKLEKSLSDSNLIAGEAANLAIQKGAVDLINSSKL